jgi:hypothetical protein
MKSFTNEEAFRHYRLRIAEHLKTNTAENFARFSDPGMMPTLLTGVWFGRYSIRGGAIAGTGAHGALPLADTGAAAMLIACNRRLDVAEPIDPNWQSQDLRDIIARCATTMRNMGGQIDIKAAEDPHGYGPSIRRLWAQAKRIGLSDDEAWTHVKEWALRQPKLAKAPAPAMELAERFARAARWSSSNKLESPWTTTVGAESWHIRLNDFPEECMYGLWIGDTCLGVFNDWPEAWERAGAPRKAKPKPVAAPALTGVAAERWLDRYVAGEHAAVWAEMVSAGPQVRAKPFAAPAWSVAQETMGRARHNVEQIIRRLDALNYRFIEPAKRSWPDGGDDAPITFSLQTPQGHKPMTMSVGDIKAKIKNADLSHLPAPARKSLEQMRDFVGGLATQFDQASRAAQAAGRAKPKSVVSNHLEDTDVFLPPDAGEAKTLAKLERKKLYLPLSLRAWIEMVGRIDLSGSHPALSFLSGPDFPNIHADPLMVIPTAEWIADELEGWQEAGSDEDDKHELFISFLDTDKTELNKAEEQMGEGYGIQIPDAAADAPLLNERHEAGFVDYLRLAFRYGGFPGWERYDKRPEKELAFLTDGLLPI